MVMSVLNNGTTKCLQEMEFPVLGLMQCISSEKLNTYTPEKG